MAETFTSISIETSLVSRVFDSTIRYRVICSLKIISLGSHFTIGHLFSSDKKLFSFESKDEKARQRQKPLMNVRGKAGEARQGGDTRLCDLAE